MHNMSPQRLKAKGHELGIDPIVLENASKAIQQIATVDTRLFPLLTLNHLSVVTGLKYGFLRNTVARKTGRYRHFYMKKKVPGRRNVRMISIPEKRLMFCQKWIAQNILRFGPVHPSSFAYHPESNPVFAARAHSNAKWLIKVDIQDFFHAISEHRIYGVFRSLGYSKILSLELSRLCTMPAERRGYGKDPNAKYSSAAIRYYDTPTVGILPQGAPTSPMLSNLAMREIDEALAQLAEYSDMRFSRYADDIVFSCADLRNRKNVNQVKRAILNILNQHGFRPNLRKTVVRGPGERKIVLGMLVDSNKPRLTREYKDLIRLHLHYLTHPDFGPAKHANARKTSISKIYHHVFGTICWARVVEPNFGDDALVRFNSINWPPVVKPTYYSDQIN
jgi:RNA-directed DNA polymerase